MTGLIIKEKIRFKFPDELVADTISSFWREGRQAYLSDPYHVVIWVGTAPEMVLVYTG